MPEAAFATALWRQQTKGIVNIFIDGAAVAFDDEEIVTVSATKLLGLLVRCMKGIKGGGGRLRPDHVVVDVPVAVVAGVWVVVPVVVAVPVGVNVDVVVGEEIVVEVVVPIGVTLPAVALSRISGKWISCNTVTLATMRPMIAAMSKRDHSGAPMID